jgi:hypothetical protein
MYEDLLMMMAAPGHFMSFVPTISTGAAVVEAQKGVVEGNGFDSERYLDLAKRSLLHIVYYGHEHARVFAVEGLRNFRDSNGIKKELLSIAKARNDAQLMAAIMGSLDQLRVNEEIEIARADRQMMMDVGQYDETEPGRLYADMLFSAVETVLAKNFEEEARDEVKIAVMQLARSGIDSEPTAGLLDDLSQKLVRKNVENALIHALRNKDEEIREEAIEGLCTLGGGRVTNILMRISEREVADNDLTATGKAAREVLLRIHRKENPALPPPIPPAALRKRKPQPRLRVR